MVQVNATLSDAIDETQWVSSILAATVYRLVSNDNSILHLLDETFSGTFMCVVGDIDVDNYNTGPVIAVATATATAIAFACLFGTFVSYKILREVSNSNANNKSAATSSRQIASSKTDNNSSTTTPKELHILIVPKKAVDKSAVAVSVPAAHICVDLDDDDDDDDNDNDDSNEENIDDFDDVDVSDDNSNDDENNKEEDEGDWNEEENKQRLVEELPFSPPIPAAATTTTKKKKKESLANFGTNPLSSKKSQSIVMASMTSNALRYNKNKNMGEVKNSLLSSKRIENASVMGSDNSLSLRGPSSNANNKDNKNGRALTNQDDLLITPAQHTQDDDEKPLVSRNILRALTLSNISAARSELLEQLVTTERTKCTFRDALELEVATLKALDPIDDDRDDVDDSNSKAPETFHKADDKDEKKNITSDRTADSTNSNSSYFLTRLSMSTKERGWTKKGRRRSSRFFSRFLRSKYPKKGWLRSGQEPISDDDGKMEMIFYDS